ncbi:MAG TPA: DUF2339 domain-containing protein [Ferruginibacter sp.]|nr:DUF2339 domain-containing protein [Ferruginibacter sp.]
METFLSIALVVVIILLANIISKQKESTNAILKNILSLQKELKSLKDKLSNPITGSDDKKESEIVTPIPATTVPSPVTTPVAKQPEQEIQVIVKTVKAVPKYMPKPQQDSWWQKWIRNNPDIEKFIGENLFNKIGIAVLVLGIAFFVKYAIDQNWITEIGRVCIGIGCGLILVGLAHYLRNTYRSFSSVLAGGGIAIFYFTIAFAFHQYQIFSQTTAFIIMVVITGFAVALAILYNKLELAIIAVIGGFLAPFLVSHGDGNYVVLFSYIIILNIGMLGLSYFKKWPAINIISLFFTIIIFGAWLIKCSNKDNWLPYKDAILFASIFYFIFLAMAMINNIREQKAFKALDFSILLAINFTYFSAGIYALHYWNNGVYQGLFTVVIGVINLSLAYYLFKTQKGDRNLLFLLIGLTLTFISLAAPIQLHGHTITLFWSAECVLLYWLYQRSKMVIFKYSSAIVLLLMIASLILDWIKADTTASKNMALIFSTTQGIITTIVSVIAFGCYCFLLSKEDEKASYIFTVTNGIMIKALLIVGAAVAYLTCMFVVNLCFNNYDMAPLPNVYHQLVTYLFIIILLILLRKYFKGSEWLQLLLIGCAGIVYIYSSHFLPEISESILLKKYPYYHMVSHWVASAVFIYLLYAAIGLYRKQPPFPNTILAFTWAINILFVTFLSIECMQVYIWINYHPNNIEISSAQYIKAGLTILWALCSFGLIWLGMKYKYKPLRIIALSLFAIALLKLFLFDIENISEGGKIIAFIMLGVLLLVVSFMYQRLKKIIIEDEAKTS